MKNKLTTFLFLLSLFIVPQLSYSQIENLVFEGGGIRGIAYSGSLEVLESNGKLTNLKRVAGTSVGAIQATLVALGYTPQEMTEIVAELNLKHFNDGKVIFIGGFTRLFKRYGWYRGEKLSSWIGSMIEKKTGNRNITFMQLHERSLQENFKDLYITGTNLTQQKPEIFSFESYPDMKVKDAVRISVSIPLYFRAVLMDSIGHITYKPCKGAKQQVLIDGGITQNFPIQIFDRSKYVFDNDTSTTYLFNKKTLGIRLDSDEQIEYDLNEKGLAPYPITSFKTYIGAFYNIVIENLNRQRLTSDDWKRTISVSTAGIGPKVKQLPSSDKNILLECGRKGAERFLKEN